MEFVGYMGHFILHFKKNIEKKLISENIHRFKSEILADRVNHLSEVLVLFKIVFNFTFFKAQL